MPDPEAETRSGSAGFQTLELHPQTGEAALDLDQELALTPGEIVAGRYRIVSLLGRGGMGEVYRATISEWAIRSH